MAVSGPARIVAAVDPLDPTEVYPEEPHPPTVARSQRLCSLRHRVSRYARDGALDVDDLERIEARARENLKLRALEKLRGRK